MAFAILDCYTDEASGLGVPPYLGTYPRYLYGFLKTKYPDEEVYYLTIDDLRLWKKYDFKNPNINLKPSGKTNIRVYNLTKNSENIADIMKQIDELIVILGVHVPGKYLSAMPGTLHEVTPLLEGIKCRKVLTGPAMFGTQLFGGKFTERVQEGVFEERKYDFTFDEIAQHSIAGIDIVTQIPWLKMIEIETGKGCNVGKCSFCTEPLKSKVLYRKNEEVLAEVKAFYEKGERYFRLGKQTCFYSLPDPIGLLESIRKECPDIKVLHIDNVNPIFAWTKRGEKITQAIVKHCTPGNIAAFGVESFDGAVTEANKLNCSADIAMRAIRAINKYGKVRGDNGMPTFLPGLNIIFGLAAESRKTHEINMEYLQKIMDEDLWLRRINIRQVALFEGTDLYLLGDKWLKRNKKWYWKWRRDVRENIDYPMLQKIVPTGTVLKDCYAEIYDGKTTFMRQFGTYPLIVGVKGRYPLKEFYDLRIVKHQLRSLTGFVEEKYSDK
jgi:radical SAM superfamily enzyme with C-terminal helix-hairpin-helix motif